MENSSRNQSFISKIGRSVAVQKKEATLEISQGLRNFEFATPAKLDALDFSLYSFLSFLICPFVIVILC